MMRRILAMLIFVIGFFHASVFAASMQLPRSFSSEKVRPGAASGPTLVAVAIWVADIPRIDSVAQTFSADIAYVLRWRDPALAHGEPHFKRYNLNEIWHPDWQVVNVVGSPARSFPEVVEVAGDGTVTFRQRIFGSFSQATDLHAFPFDKGSFRIQFITVAQSPAEIRFVPDETKVNVGLTPSLGIAPHLTIQDWQITSHTARVLPFSFSPRLEFASFVFEFQAERLSGHYTVKVILPLLLIVMMSWTAFWIDSTMAASQIGVATSSMLTLIAYRFSVGADVPKIPYLTKLDSFILTSSVLIFFTLIEVIVTSKLAFNQRLDLSRKIDHYSRVAFPLAYFVVMIAIMLR